MKLLKKYLGIALLYVISIGMLLLTNPQRISPVLLVVPLLIFFFALFLTLIAILRGMLRQRGKTLPRGVISFVAVLTGFPVLLILLQSIGQLSARDVITLVSIGVVLTIYVSKIGFRQELKH